MKQRFLTKKDFIKSLFQVNEKKNSGVLRLNQIIPKLLTISKMFAVKLLANSAVVCNCYIVLNMPSIFIFYISHESC